LVLLDDQLNPMARGRFPDKTGHRVDKSGISNGKQLRFFYGGGIAPVIGSASLHQPQATTSAHRKTYRVEMSVQ